MVADQPAKAEAELRKAIQLDAHNGRALLGLAAIQITLPPSKPVSTPT